METTYKQLLDRVAEDGSPSGPNLVAFSGGVDSSLVAHAVHAVYPGSSTAVMALSPSVSDDMRRQAEQIAAHIGIPLRFVETEEFRDATYVANEGMSCYICKTHIYEALRAVSREAADDGAVLFSGNNADDSADPTRVGLRAAREHAVCSPLDGFSKDTVRALSRHAGLPNWEHAASPCLRSRLASGIEATPAHLARIEQAEARIRDQYALPPSANFRVRMLAEDHAMIELDEELLPRVDLDRCATLLRDLDFREVQSRPFRSGSVSIQIQLPAS
ncbi:hypothetical protein KQI65_00910 [bacterium]|nr:hypothetical protein [bacterium]